MPVFINPDMLNKEIIVPGLDQWPEFDNKILLLATIFFVIILILKRRIETQFENE